jgi:5-methylcytosine-specific restriction endonuclease McrA
MCDWCGEPVNRPASDFHGKRAFCNSRCMAEWQSEFVSGVAHPRWQGGPPRSYGIGWREARRSAMQRANGLCQRCGKTARDVHHLLPIRYFARLQDAHFASNLISVCFRCHTAEHRNLQASMPLLDLLQAQQPGL